MPSCTVSPAAAASASSGLHAGADHDQVGNEHVAVAGFERDAAVELRRHLRDRCCELELDAVVLVFGEDQRAGFLVAGARHDARCELDHRHLDAQLGRRGRDLEPDQARADHDQVLAARESAALSARACASVRR